MFAVCLLTAVLAASSPSAAAAAPAPAASTAGFEDHRDARDDGVRFVARRGDTTTFLTRDALVVALHPRGADGTSFALRFEGACDDVVLEPLGAPRATVNVHRGGVRRDGLSTYGAVRYRGLWDGVDLRVYQTPAGLEYDVELAPGADLADVSIRCEGVARLERLDATRVSLVTSLGAFEQTIPASWTVSDDGARTPVDARFVVDGEQLRFDVGAHDATRPLVIDPGLSYGTYLGGSLRDIGTDVVAIPNGDVFVAGSASSTNFPTTIGAPLAGLADTFVARFDDETGALVWATLLGGTDNNFLQQEGAVALGLFGEDVYVTGRAASPDFPTTPGVVQPARPGGEDGFVARLGPTGALAWSSYLGGTGDDRPRALSVDAAGHVVVAGSTSSDDFPTTPGALSDTKSAIFVFTDAFATVFAPDGTSLVASTYYGGTLRTEANGVHLADDGTLTLGGLTSASDLPVSAGAFDETYNGASGTERDGFVARLDATASSLLFGTYIGGPGLEEILALDVEQGGAVVAAGVARDGDFPTTPGAWQTTFGGGASDGFALRLSSDGTTLSWSSFFGGGADDEAVGVGAQPGGTGAVTIVGWTDSVDLPLGGELGQAQNAGGRDAFVTRFDVGGGALLFAGYHGGSGDDTAHGLWLDDVGTAWFTGETMSADLPLAGASVARNNAGNGDAFVARVDIAPWVDLGSAKTGSNGVAPRLAGTGTLVGGTLGQLTVADAPPSAPSALFVGLAAGNVPFKQGTLVPFPIVLNISLPTFPDGSLFLPFAWPTGIPAGLPFTFQLWSSDPGVPGNVAATNGLQGIAG